MVHASLKLTSTWWSLTDQGDLLFVFGFFTKFLIQYLNACLFSSRGYFLLKMHDVMYVEDTLYIVHVMRNLCKVCGGRKTNDGRLVKIGKNNRNFIQIADRTQFLFPATVFSSDHSASDVISSLHIDNNKSIRKTQKINYDSRWKEK